MSATIAGTVGSDVRDCEGRGDCGTDRHCVFETILEQMGPENATPEKPMPMKLEAWPGGRWFRDLGRRRGALLGQWCRRLKRRRCWRSGGRCLCRIRRCRICSTG